jgi:hypothetical protein
VVRESRVQRFWPLQEDLYSGYDDASSPLAESGIGSFPMCPNSPASMRKGKTTRLGTGARLGTVDRVGSAIGRGPIAGPPGTAFGPPATSLRMATGSLSEDGARPMTSSKGAGYVSTKGPSLRGSANAGMHRPKGPSTAEICKQLEIDVHRLMEEAASLAKDGAFNDGM